MSFSSLKKNRGNIESLQKSLEQMNQKQSYGDDRIWYPKRDKSGNAFAVIRFLPPKDGEELPWARVWEHGFKGPGGKWYIENCPTTIGADCPVCQANNELWNSGVESDKDIVRDRKRKLHYFANIIVIKDSEEPENEGKVFLYKFGKKIFAKIEDIMDPEFEDEKPVNPFDFWDGADFKLKVRKVEGYANYDKSEFDSPSALFDGDDSRLEEVYDKMYSLKEFTSTEKFKPYDELDKRLKSTLGVSSKGETTAGESKPAPSFAETTATEETVPSDGAAGEEDGIDYFKRLAGEE
jgi:hypothetical protein